MQIGMSTSSSISVDIGVVYGTENDGTIELRITLFSTTFIYGSIAFFYKRHKFDDWMDDACIIFSSSKFQNGNKLHGLPCSLMGSESRLIWDYKKNGLVFGSNCIIKAVVIPSLNVISQVDEFSRIETVFNNDRIIDKGLSGSIIGFDFNGNFIKLESDNVSTVEPKTLNTVTSLTGLNNPVHAVGTSSGGLIVLDSVGTITECDQNGVIIVTFDASAMALGSYATLTLNYDTNNLLISGGNISSVNEIAWGGIDHGTVLWNYSASLSLPTGAVYGDSLETVLFCDYGNNRIVVIDRSYSSESVNTITSVTTDGNSLTLKNPIRCAMLYDKIYVCEETGRVENFEETISTHPAMARSGFGTASCDNAIPQFAKMRFMPIVRSVK